METNAAETEEMAAKRDMKAKRHEEMTEIIQENNYLHKTIHRLEAKVAATEERAAKTEERAVKREAKRDAEMKKIIKENNYLHETIYRLEACYGHGQAR